MTGEKVKAAEEENPVNNVVSGGISGAITDENTVEAQKDAIMKYEKIRNDKYDIEKIALHTSYSELQIELIKNYLFYAKHKRVGGKIERFDPDFYIAQSWTRLAYEPQNIQEHDLVLLKHESMEMSLVMQGYEQNQAHKIAEDKYNYSRDAKEFYKILRIKQKRKHKETPITYNNLKKIKKLQEKANKREDIKSRKYKGGK